MHTTSPLGGLGACMPPLSPPPETKKCNSINTTLLLLEELEEEVKGGLEGGRVLNLPQHTHFISKLPTKERVG